MRRAVVPLAAGIGLGALVAVAGPASLAALALPIVIAAPAATGLLLIAGVEEFLSSGGVADDEASVLVSLGTEALYQSAPVAPAAIVLALCVGLLLRRIPAAELKRGPLVWILMFIGWALALNLAQSGVSGLAYAIGPVSCLLLGYLLGLRASRLSPETLCRGIAAVVVGKCLLGILALVTSPLRADRFLIYYDPVTAGLAFALLVALATASPFDDWSRALPRIARYVVPVAAVLVGLMSLRRSVWLGAAVALVLALLLRGQARLFVRTAAAIFFALIIANAGAPGLLDAATERAGGALGFVVGRGQDDSAEGHLDDLGVGLDHARRAPLLGVGVQARQLPGLDAEDADRLYVHDEFLQTWLRYGVVGLLLLVGVLTSAAAAAVSTLKINSSTPSRVAAAFVVGSFATLIFFPSLTTSWRWPAAFGVAVGLVTISRRGGVRSEEQQLVNRHVHPG